MPYCAPSVKGAQCQAYSCEPSVRGSGWPAQPGISSLVRRGARPALTSRNLTCCITRSDQLQRKSRYCPLPCCSPRLEKPQRSKSSHSAGFSPSMFIICARKASVVVLKALLGASAADWPPLFLASGKLLSPALAPRFETATKKSPGGITIGFEKVRFINWEVLVLSLRPFAAAL